MNWFDIVPGLGEVANSQAEMLDMEQAEGWHFTDVDEMADEDLSYMPTPQEIEDGIDSEPAQSPDEYPHCPYEDSDHMEAWDMQEFKAQRREHAANLKRAMAHAFDATHRKTVPVTRTTTVVVAKVPYQQRMNNLRAQLIAKGLIKPQEKEQACQHPNAPLQ